MPEAHRRLLPLLQRGDGALGRAGGDLRPPTAAGSSPGWTATGCGRCATPMTADGLLIVGSETGMVKIAGERASSPRAGVGPGQMHRRRPRRGPLLPRRASSRTCWRRASPSAEWTERIIRIDSIVKDRAGPSRCLYRARGAAPPPARGRLHAGGAGDASCTRWWRTAQGGHRLDGRRHADRGAVRASTAACTTIFRQTFSQVTNPPID